MHPGNYGMVPETTYYAGAPVYPSFSGYQSVQNPHPLYQGTRYYHHQPLPVHHGFNPQPSMHYQHMTSGPPQPIQSTTSPITQGVQEQVQFRSHAVPIVSPPLPARVARFNPPPPFPLPPRLKALGDMVVSRHMNELKEDVCHTDFIQLASQRGIEVRKPLESISSNQQSTPNQNSFKKYPELYKSPVKAPEEWAELKSDTKENRQQTPTNKPTSILFENNPGLNMPPVKEQSVPEPDGWPELKWDMKENKQSPSTVKLISFENNPGLNMPPVKEQSVPETEDWSELKCDMKENKQSTISTIKLTPKSFENNPELNTPLVKKQSVPEPDGWPELKLDMNENCATNSKDRIKVGNNLNSGSRQMSTVSSLRSEEQLDVEEQWEDCANEVKDHGISESDVENFDIEIKEHEILSTPFNSSTLTEDSDVDNNAAWEPCVRITDGFENKCSVDPLKNDDSQSLNFRQRASQYGISITAPMKSNKSKSSQIEKNNINSKCYLNGNENEIENMSVESSKSNNSKGSRSKPPLERLAPENLWSEDSDNSSYSRADTWNVTFHHKRLDDSGSDVFSLEGSQSDPVDAFKMKASRRGIRIEDPKDAANIAPESDTDSELGTVHISRSNSIDTTVGLRVSTPDPGVEHLNPEVPEFEMNLETTVSKLEDLPVQKTVFLNPDSLIFQQKQKKEQVHSEVSNTLTNLSSTDQYQSVSSDQSMKSEAPSFIQNQSTTLTKINDSVTDTALEAKAKIFHLTSPVRVKVKTSVATQASPTITSSCVGTERVKTNDCAMNTGSCETREVGINTGNKSDNKKGTIIHASKTKLISKSTNTRQVAQRTVGVNVKFKVEAKKVDKTDASTMVDLVEYKEVFEKTDLINKLKDLQTELLNHKGKEVIHKLLQQKRALKKKSEVLVPFFTRCEESETFSSLIMNKISSIEKSIIQIQVEMEETLLQINSDKGLNQLPDFDTYLSLTHCLPKTYRPSLNLSPPGQHLQIDLSPKQNNLQSRYSGAGISGHSPQHVDDIPRHIAGNINNNANSLASTCVFSQMCESTTRTAGPNMSMSSILRFPHKHFHTSPLRLPEEPEFMPDKCFMNLDEQIKIKSTCEQTGSFDQISETSITKLAKSDKHDQVDWEKNNTLQESTPEECITEQNIIKDNTLQASLTTESYGECSTEKHREKNNTLEESALLESYEECSTGKHREKNNTLEESALLESYKECSTEKHREKNNTLEDSTLLESYEECSTEKHREKNNTLKEPTLEETTLLETYKECSTEKHREKNNTLEESALLESYKECSTEKHREKNNILEESALLESYKECSTEKHREKNNILEESALLESYKECSTEKHREKNNILEESTILESYKECSTEKHREKDNTLEDSTLLESYKEWSTEKHREKDNTLQASTVTKSYEERSTEKQSLIMKQSVEEKEAIKATETNNGLDAKTDVSNIEIKDLISQVMLAAYSGLENRIENQFERPPSIKQEALKSMDSIDSEEEDFVNRDSEAESVQKDEMKSDTVEPLNGTGKIMHELHGPRDDNLKVLTVTKGIEYQEVDSGFQELNSDIASADVNEMKTEGIELDMLTQTIINPPINDAIVDATVKSIYETKGGLNDLEECTDEEEDMDVRTKYSFQEAQTVRLEENKSCIVKERAEENMSCAVKDRTEENMSSNVKDRTEENISCTVKDRTEENKSCSVKDRTKENISCYENKIKVSVSDDGSKQLDKAEPLLVHHTVDSQLPVDISQHSSSQNDNQNLVSAFDAKELFMSPVKSSNCAMAVDHPIRQPEMYPNVDLVPGIAPLMTGPTSLTKDLDPLLFQAVMTQLIQAYPQLAGDQVMLMNVAMQQTNILQMYMQNQQDSGADQLMGANAVPNILNVPCENPLLENPSLSLNAIQDSLTDFPKRSVSSDNNGILTTVSTKQSSVNTLAVSTSTETSTSCSVNSASLTDKTVQPDDFTIVKPNKDENLASSSKGTLDNLNFSSSHQVKPGMQHNLSQGNNSNVEIPLDAASCTGVSAFSRKTRIKAETSQTTEEEVSKPTLTDFNQTRLKVPQPKTTWLGTDLGNNPKVPHNLQSAKQADFLPDFAKKHNPCNVNTRVTHSFIKQLDDQVLRSINYSDEVHFVRKTPSPPSIAEPERKYSFNGEQYPTLSDRHDPVKKPNQFRSSIPPSGAKQRQEKEHQSLYVLPNKRREIQVSKDSTPQCIQQTEDWEAEANPFPQTFGFNPYPPSKLIMNRKPNTGMESKHKTGMDVKQSPTMEVKQQSKDKVRKPSGSTNADICNIPSPKITKTESPDQAKVKENKEEDWCEVTSKRQRHRSKEQPAKKVSQSTLPSSSTKQVRMTNFEKLIGRLHEEFPGCSRQSLMDAIAKIRAQRGSMSGLGMQTIIESVSSFLEKKAPKHIPGLNYPSGAATKNVMNTPSYARQLSASNKSAPGPINAQRTAGPKHELNIPKFTPSSIVHNIGYDDDEDICVICHDGLSTMETMELDCHHVYHYKCISQWVERDRTCPTCRKLALFPEDFPRLGR